MAYEVFEAKYLRFDSPAISIRPDGAMRLNADAAAVLKDSHAEQILLLWDEEKKKIALSVAPKHDPRAFKVAYSKKGNGASFAAKAFAKHIGWRAERAVGLPLKMVNSMLEATLPAANLPPYPEQTTKGVRMGKNKPEK